ncbi:hypothetical protein [Motilibacter deserti]|uniref:NUDIX hydrolase n=1 Tax=Motilibacter deserti TaxID=2714956 RepID=A0ABX0GQ00_9ACTN|nr:hypothetical protein [Motilibacter deserti]NHC12565.1 hypothetical protein [Motilibacter deserti]
MHTSTALHDVVRPEDGETLGRVRRTAAPDGWRPETVFGAALGEPVASREEAEDVVRSRGLAALSEPWEVRRPGEEWQQCWLLEVRPERVRVSWTPPKYLLAGQAEDVDVPPAQLRLPPG